MTIFKKKLWWLIWVSAAVLGLTMFLPLGADALARNIAMSPTETHASLQPGETATGNFSVINQGDTSFDYNVTASAYRVIGENYTPAFTQLPGVPDVSKWISFSKSSGTLDPGGSDQINYSLTVPSGTTAGGYYLAVLAETKNPPAVQGVTVTDQVGQVFYINIPGNVPNKGSLLTWQSSFLQYPPLTSIIRIKDSGSLNFESKVTYKISDIFGGQKYYLSGGDNLLPHTIRRVTLIWKKSPSFGLFKVNGKVTVLSHTYALPTKYVLVMSKTVRIIFIASVIVIILLIIFYETRKHRKKKRLHRI